LPKIARIAYVVAFVMTGLVILAALRERIVILPLALIPLASGIGIIRKRAWSAYGLALYQFAQLLLLPLLIFRSGSIRPLLPQIIAGCVLALFLVPLFFFAGRSLSVAGADRGRAWPWIAVAALTTLPLIFVQAFVMPTGSMEETLLVGDRILVQRFPKPTPVRGDIIVFAYPIDRTQTFTKRVIGIPGDRIKIVNKIVYRNGAVVHEPYVVHKNPYEDSYRDNLPSESESPIEAVAPFAAAAKEMLQKHVVNGELVVPAGKYFVLGDNRDNSLDSRYWGFVGFNDLIGKPLLIYDSEQQATELIEGRSPRSHRVRWNRLFKLL
jgi:signal peptidase I